ncbi:Uncharacterised protein [Shigella sonnei]|nr:Uncharacterised protein [Shigella sonnei]
MRGERNRRRISNNTFRRFIEIEQDIDGNRPCDQRIIIETRHPLPIVGQIASFHIGINKKQTTQTMP